MKSKIIFSAVSVMSFLIISIFFSTSVLAEEITIRGEVNYKYQIVSDEGETYEIADSDMGDELVSKHIGEIVTITGIVEESDEGDKIITVTSYEVEDME